MRKFEFNKLVRDNIVKNILIDGNTIDWKILSSEEYLYELKRKLFEEAKELPESQGEETIKELADLQEVIDNLLLALGLNSKKLKSYQLVKNKKVGSFKMRHYIRTIQLQDNSKWVNYYAKDPTKYPEIK